MSVSKLFMIISSGDSHVITDVALMYGVNAPKFGWMDEVVLIFWGPAQKTILEDSELGNRVKKTVNLEKIEVWACKACSDGYGVSEKLEKLGITVKYVGEYVTRMLKDGWYTLTF
jgi:hypothetical protein